MPLLRVGYLIASHNRRELTMRAVDRALAGAGEAQIAAKVFLFDDGSHDGTADAVESRFESDAIVLRGDGSAFWARAMSIVEERALRDHFDLLIWLNDDVILDSDAIARVVAAHRRLPGRILVASFRDPRTGGLTYGGLVSGGLHPLRFRLVPPDCEQEVHTMNGNLVAVPTTLARELGGIDGEFSHAWADIDYGLRAKRRGHTPILLAGTFGSCPRNPLPGRSSLTQEWRRFVSVKGGGNPRSMARLMSRAAPATWPAWWVATYVKWAGKQARDRLLFRRGRTS